MVKSSDNPKITFERPVVQFAEVEGKFVPPEQPVGFALGDHHNLAQEGNLGSQKQAPAVQARTPILVYILHGLDQHLKGDIQGLMWRTGPSTGSHYEGKAVLDNPSPAEVVHVLVGIPESLVMVSLVR